MLQNFGKDIERISESKILIMRAWEKSAEINRSGIQDLEIKLNIALDLLRQEHNRSKMDKMYFGVTEILDSIRTKCQSNYLNEVKVIEEYYKMIKLEADVLSSEIKEFIYTLHKMPATETICNFKSCEVSNNNINEKIGTCRLQISCVKSWKFGVWKALESLFQNARKCLEEKTESWISSKTRDLSQKIEFQMEIHERRYQRIATEIYETRLREVKQHVSFFEEHKAGIQHEYRKMKENLSNSNNKMSGKLALLQEKLKKEEKTKTENCLAVVTALKYQFEKEKKEFEKEMKNIFEGFSGDCESKIFSPKQENINFMKGIKLFYEDGNYNPEEGKFFIGQLEVIDRELSLQLTNFVKEVSNAESEPKKKGLQIYDEVIQVFSWICDELKFNDQISSCLYSFTKKIQEYALGFNSDYQLLKRQSEQIFTLIEEPDRLLSDIEDRCWVGLSNALLKNICNVFYPVRDLAVPVDREEETEESSNRIYGLSEVSGRATASNAGACQSTKKEQFACRDYKKDLFNEGFPPENDNTFMALISNKLWEYMDCIQRLGCNFYRKAKDRLIIRNELIHQSYELFADEMLKKFQSCDMQCEKLWLQTLLDFLPIIARIKNSFNEYVQRRVGQYQERQVNAVIAEYESFARRMREEAENDSKECKKLDDKLLPFYGYPTNSDLLNQLQEEVVFSTARQSVTWESVIISYKNRLTSLRNDYVLNQTELKETEERLSRINYVLFNDELGDKLLNSVSEYCRRGGYHTKTSRSRETRMEKKNRSKFILEKKELNLNAPSLDDIEACLNRLEGLIKQDNLFGKPLDLKKVIGPTRKLINDLICQLKLVADSETRIHQESIFKWLNVWKCSLRKIKKLYTVKYSEIE